MIDSKKLLYIFPDVAYVAELLPTKKEHSFAIHTFRQINGEFIDDNEFIDANVEKLINKLDPEEYHLILPDFLFTNTIVQVEADSETKVKDYLKSKLLPELGLSKDTHELKTFILTERGGKSRVQLSALEKSLMNPISARVKAKNIKISAISPISWTVKSIVSLEPSISIVQMGSMLYLSEHYIGTDQSISASIEDVEKLSETIKTLKGAEPSIQTVYLITNNLVEQELKELLSNTLPLQQLASFKEDESEMPSYVKFVIEAGMKTLSIDAYPVPQFPLSEPTEELPAKSAAESTTSQKDEMAKSDDNELPKPKMSDEVSDMDEETAVAPVAAKAAIAEIDLDGEAESDEDVEEVSAPVMEKKEEEEEVMDDKEKEEDKGDDDEKEDHKEEAKLTITESKTTAIETETTKPSDDDDNLKAVDDVMAGEKVVIEKAEDIIKNQSGVQPMLKMLGLSFLVFLVTVAVGIGIGRGFIMISQNQGGEEQKTEEVAEVEATPEPTPTPTPEPEIDVSKLDALVVNATTKAGYAGTIKSKLEDADFGSVKAGNAKGDYEDGNFLLVSEENESLLAAVEKATGLDFQFSDKKDEEDAGNSYDLVVVLAE